MSNETVVHDPRTLGCCTHLEREAQIQHNFYMVTIEQRDAAYAKLEIAREALEGAVTLIQNEYCSHSSPCSPSDKWCYASKQLDALARLD